MQTNYGTENQNFEEVYEKLKQIYTVLYKESENLYKENINIYYDYNFTFGEVNYKRYELYYLCQRLTKKMEIYFDQVYNKAKINTNQIESKLNEIFKDLKYKIDLIKNEYEQAKVFINLPVMSESDALEIVEIFNYIIKYLHPDFSNRDESLNKLWKKSYRAYRNNDLNILRKCKKRLNDLNLDLPSKVDKKIDYKKKIKKLQDKIQIYTTKNCYLMNSFPYNQKCLLGNKVQIEKKIKVVEADIELLKMRLANLEFIMDEFLLENKVYIC